MPALSHELIVDMFRDRPTLALDLVESHLGVALPKYDRAEVMSADLTDVTPTEFRADVAIRVTDHESVSFALIVEVQQRPDKRKRFVWPAYVGKLYARMECPVFLLVACPDARVAAWCAKPVTIGDPPYFLMSPFVLDLQRVPRITDEGRAQQSPELAVLSALAHGGKPGSEPVLRAFAAALGTLDVEHADLYTDFLLGALPEAGRAILRSLMSTVSRYRPVSDWGRSHFRNGELNGEIEALLTVLSARGLDVTDDARARITECTDIEQLTTWIRRAVTADGVEEIFG